MRIDGVRHPIWERNPNTGEALGSHYRRLKSFCETANPEIQTWTLQEFVDRLRDEFRKRKKEQDA